METISYLFFIFQLFFMVLKSEAENIQSGEMGVHNVSLTAQSSTRVDEENAFLFNGNKYALNFEQEDFFDGLEACNSRNGRFPDEAQVDELAALTDYVFTLSLSNPDVCKVYWIKHAPKPHKEAPKGFNPIPNSGLIALYVTIAPVVDSEISLEPVEVSVKYEIIRATRMDEYCSVCVYANS